MWNKRFSTIDFDIDPNTLLPSDPHWLVWNTQWYLVILGGTLLDDADEGIQRFSYGTKNPDGTRDGYGVKDIKLFFQTYSLWGD
jgi:hypothetical protein